MAVFDPPFVAFPPEGDIPDAILITPVHAPVAAAPEPLNESPDERKKRLNREAQARWRIKNMIGVQKYTPDQQQLLGEEAVIIARLAEIRAELCDLRVELAVIRGRIAKKPAG